MMAYIHIPFCISKCIYCDFYSETSLELKKEYLKYLKKEIDLRYKKQYLSSIYFGGGTPSLLDLEEISEILSKFKKNKECEITLECNPEDITEEKILNFKKAGVNRFSLGVQSLMDFELKLLKRRHDREKALKALKILKENTENFSCDIILGIKGQREENLLETLKELTSFSPPHISIYPLEMKKYNNLMERDERKAELMETAWNFLNEKGYIHYEISNFSKEGYISKHNMGYWMRNHYYGFGPSAHSFLNSKRFRNTNSLKTYINYLKKGKLYYSNFQILKREEIEWEKFILSLRTNKGYPSKNFEIKKLKDFIEEGFMEIKGNRIKLKDKGMLIFNSLVVKLYSHFKKEISHS